MELISADGAPLADAVAKTLIKSCRIKAGLDAATACARYNKRKDLFQTSVKVPKGTSLGAHVVMAELLDAEGGVAATATTVGSVVPSRRPRP